jgi:hypothetical protein
MGSLEMSLKASLHFNDAQHQVVARDAIADGLSRCKVEVCRGEWGQKPAGVDFAVVWGVRQSEVMSSGVPVLVMERGYLGDRHYWTSLAWDGLNGWGRRVAQKDCSDDRLDRHFPGHIKPWRQSSGRYALVVGQVKGDASIAGVDIDNWYRNIFALLRDAGWEVCFRQHPVEAAWGVSALVVDGMKVITGSLSDALADAGLVVTYNSNTGVDAAMAGVPVCAEDRGSMAWPVASPTLVPHRPERRPWAAWLASAQWSLEEIRLGAFWRGLKRAM